MRVLFSTLATVAACASASCGATEPSAATPSPGRLSSAQLPGATQTPAGGDAVRRRFAIALHGGAGAPPRDLDAERRQAYVQGLQRALRTGCEALEGNGSSLDVVEQVVRMLESDPSFNAGRGAVYTREGRHELDASIMDGRTLACGAVAAVRTIEHPISAARAVMERTRHVLLSGEGAERFAEEVGMKSVPNDFFSTPRRRRQLERRLQEQGIAPPLREGDAGTGDSGDEHGTVGAVALDRHGHLAAATSTGGLTAKRWGRIGDSPLVGAGTYAADGACAVSGTGIGEEFIRHSIARMVAARMQLRDEDVEPAAEAVLEGRLQPDQGGLIAVSHAGRIAMVYNTDGMFRGACDSTGRFEVRIWEGREALAGAP